MGDVAVKSEELAHYVADFIGGACSRVMGTGAIQYEENGQQKFESMSLDELVDWTIEELQDVAVYACMLSIRVERVKELVEGRAQAVAATMHEADLDLAKLRAAIPNLKL